MFLDNKICELKQKAMKAKSCDRMLKQKASNGIPKRDFEYVEVRFGNPEAACRNFGICKISEVTDIERGEELQKNQCLAMIVKRGAANFEIRFLKKYLSRYAGRKYFAGGYFLIEAKFVFPQSICRKFAVKRLEICPGHYRLSETRAAFGMVIGNR